MKIPFRPPAAFGRLVKQLVDPVLSAHFALGLELARRAHWLTPPEALNGRSFAIYVIDHGLQCRFQCRDGQFQPRRASSVDLELSASLADFFQMLRGSVDADTLFFQRRLKISGDTELGLEVKNWLDATERPAWLQRLAMMREQ